ncbi:hypothetical protein IE53DRAFT_384857 [Violaceomyces palustris]|uniref:Uncharacterized protein n=1 Tax=Violaceomyces palustris TaxID=1673888 RepID=A0ACD0P3T7_9BASI|nr:hypothetical protein IE53DRAFT_384857 [Violaceomyces palustris]
MCSSRVGDSAILSTVCTISPSRPSDSERGLESRIRRSQAKLAPTILLLTFLLSAHEVVAHRPFLNLFLNSRTIDQREDPEPMVTWWC